MKRYELTGEPCPDCGAKWRRQADGWQVLRHEDTCPMWRRVTSDH